MTSSIHNVLRAVNRRFYDRFASQFDSSRQYPWPGWVRVAERLDQATSSSPSVLDIGCGNGRLGSFLAGHWHGAFRYLGLDNCAELLSAAADKLEDLVEAPELRRVDVLEADLDRALGDERFDLIALFGVLHHVPGGDARRGLLQRLGRRLTPGGVLAASVWRLDQSPRFGRRVVPWEAYNLSRTRHSRPGIDLDDLEPGDTLLSWSGDTEHPRYCHFPDEAEIKTLIDAPGLALADRFEADGPTGLDNLYLVWHDC